ncbi:hypothetical protein QYF36_023133 [Acer negundo]|nr:hypothetical protein QYF36_023133 [Acer negundo]
MEEECGLSPALYGFGNFWFSVLVKSAGRVRVLDPHYSMDPSPWLLHGGEKNEDLKFVMAVMDRMHAKSEEENDAIFHGSVRRLPVRRRNCRRRRSRVAAARRLGFGEGLVRPCCWRLKMSLQMGCI